MFGKNLDFYYVHKLRVTFNIDIIPTIEKYIDLLTSRTIVARRFVSSVLSFIIQRSLRARTFQSMNRRSSPIT